MKNNFHKMEASAVKEMLELIYKSSTDELEMLDYLVDWARIKYASEAFSPAKIELVKYIDKVFETLKENASLKTINLHHEIEENTIVFADKKMLLSIIQNIVSNAIKHTEPGGKISISSKINEDKLVVQIKDTGIGMSKDIQKKLFTPQVKVLSEKRESNKGAGIGLLLVKGFLEKCGGEIWVESIEGQGSTFYFTLPLDKPENKPDESSTIVVDEK
ncbi:MAG: HAMP domain-containing histidine kinase [Bacteroidetes bacterium]|nr:HAMP domain-containing histidine kinase [Bacteroidota bacterium]